MKEIIINPDDFEIIEIENSNENFTDIELNEYLHNHTKTKSNKDELTQQLIDFCKYISYLTNDKILNGAIEYVKKSVSLNLTNFDTDFNILIQQFVTENILAKDLIKIKAIYFSLVVRYNIMIKQENPPEMEEPMLDFFIDEENKLIYHNLSFVLKRVKENYDVGFIEFTNQKPKDEAIPNYIDYNTILKNSHHTNKEDNAKRIQFITQAKNDYLEKHQYLTDITQLKVESKTNIEQFLKVDLKKRCAEYLKTLSNPLATELDYLQKEIKQCKEAIARTKELNNKLHHGEPSTIESENINWKVKLKIAESLKVELESKFNQQATNSKTNELILHNINSKDEDGFPINEKGMHVNLMDKDGNVMIPLQSNFLISVKENIGIVFNPNDKLGVQKATDILITYLTSNFYENLEGYFTIDLTEETKLAKKLRTKEPLKILKIQMYFDWINKWLNYIGNVFNFEFKLLFYSKYKEKIKNDVLSLETGLKKINAPQNHITFTTRWIEETDKNIALETKSKEKSQPQQPAPAENKTSKKEPKKLNSFNDFFIETTPEKIDSIKNQYRNLTNGKSLAYLIYLLQNEFRVINYSLRGSTDSRKQFIKSLTGKQYISTEFVNKYFNSNELTLNIITANDTNYNLIKNNIQSILYPN